MLPSCSPQRDPLNIHECFTRPIDVRMQAGQCGVDRFSGRVFDLEPQLRAASTQCLDGALQTRVLFIERNNQHPYLSNIVIHSVSSLTGFSPLLSLVPCRGRLGPLR